MRITINCMRGSLAHKVGSDQAVCRPDGILARHRYIGPLPRCKMEIREYHPTAAGSFQLRAGYPQLGWEYIKAGR